MMFRKTVATAFIALGLIATGTPVLADEDDSIVQDCISILPVNSPLYDGQRHYYHVWTECEAGSSGRNLSIRVELRDANKEDLTDFRIYVSGPGTSTEMNTVAQNNRLYGSTDKLNPADSQTGSWAVYITDKHREHRKPPVGIVEKIVLSF